MSASAILSVMMGGALNGASAVDSVAQDDAALSAETLGAEFAALLNLEGEATEEAAEVETAPVMAPTPVMAPVIIPEAPPAPVATLEDGDTAIENDAPALSPADYEPFVPPAEDDARLYPLPEPLIGRPEKVIEETPEAAPAPAEPVEAAPAEDAPSIEIDAAEVLAAPVATSTAPAEVEGEDTPVPATRLTARPTELGEPRLTALDPRPASATGEAETEQTASVPSAEVETADPIGQADTQDAAQDTAPTANRTASAHAAVQVAQQAMAPQAQPLLRRLMEQAGQAPAERIDITPSEAAAQPANAQTVSAAQPAASSAPTALAAADLSAQPSSDAPLETADPLLAAHDAAVEASADTAEKPAESRLSLANVRTTAELAAHFIMKLGQRTSRFDMVLTPESLGMVDVTLEVDNDGQLRARMVFDNPAAAQDLRARAEELRRQLTEAGFQLSDNALEFTDRDSQSRGSFQQFFSDDRSGRRAFAGANRLAAEADTPIAPVWTSVSLTPRGVDMKV